VRPLDPRLLNRTRGGRAALGVDVLLGLVAAALLLFQVVLLAAVISDAFGRESLSRVTPLIAWLVVVVVLRSAVAVGFESTGRRAASRIASQLRMQLVGHRLRTASLDDDGASSAELASAAVQGVESLEPYFARYLPQLVLSVLVPVLVLIWTSTIDLISAAIMLVTLPLIPLFMVLIGRATGARARDRWQALGRLSSHFLDVVRGLPTLRAFNRGAAQAERIAVTSEDYRVTTMQVLRLSFLSGAALDLVATLATALVAVTLGIRLVSGEIGLRPALTVLLLTPEVYAPLRALGAQFHASADGLAAAGRILDLIDDQGPVTSGSHAAAAARAASAPGVVVPAWDRVRLEGIRAGYPGRPGYTLDGFDLEIRRGEVVALVGPSGSGKSTVAALLLGLRNPDGGRITVDGVDRAGVDLAELDIASWRREVGWLPQRPTLFRRSIAGNIRMGLRRSRAGETRTPESSDDELIRHAAASAGAAEFVDDLRNGYETVVGDSARGLSAGETRRVALARALVGSASGPAPLLVLDEPTANLDPESAAAVSRAIARAAEDNGCAVLLIEHRPEAAAAADRVVRIRDGRAEVVPSGPGGIRREGTPA
jgi:ATP-binding cassette, subfamily C, bacterial CydD